MALRQVETVTIPVLRGPPGPKGDSIVGPKGDPSTVPGPAGKDGLNGKDGKDGITTVTEVIRTEIDLSALEPVQKALDAALEDLKKLKKKRPENYFPGSGGSPDEEIVVTFDGGGSVLPTGDTQTYYVCPFNANIVSWELSGVPSGSLVIDIWKKFRAIPSVAESITGTTPPTLITQQLNTSASLSGWVVNVKQGDVFDFSISSVTTVTKAILTLKLQKI